MFSYCITNNGTGLSFILVVEEGLVKVISTLLASIKQLPSVENPESMSVKVMLRSMVVGITNFHSRIMWYLGGFFGLINTLKLPMKLILIMILKTDPEMQLKNLQNDI